MAKKALLIGVSQYEAGLPPLAAAPKDVAEMLRVLQSPELGAFDEVKTLIDPDLEAMQTAIDLLFQSCQKGDLGLLYFSGHGITDDSDRLYLATRRTSKNTFRSTAVSASFIDGIMHDHHHQRQLVLILDCCYAGAFTGVWHPKGIINLKSQFKIEEGRVLMSSSGSSEKSYEDKEGELSLYTKYLVQGIESSEADKDQDGFISANELHEYAKSLVQSSNPDMKPEIYSFKQGSKILISKARKMEITIENKVSDSDRNRFRNLKRYKTIIIVAVFALPSIVAYLLLNTKLLLFLPFAVDKSSIESKALGLKGIAASKILLKEFKVSLAKLDEYISLVPNDAEAYKLSSRSKFKK